ncbi:isatin hydrolase [Parasteatoda tepidariorum]|uniref:isatin hydrolase n=1 Tax=Parasteatoda tepidariorum TaxID=114398 RepID=UPI00077FB459|nr:isatin hydrolase [Parasteatoda tepidariorum]
MGNSCELSRYRRIEDHRHFRLKPTHKALIIWHVLAVWYYFNIAVCESTSVVDKFQLVDLTHVFDNTTLYWVTEPSLVLNVTYNGTLPDKNIWYQKDQIYGATHGGTHMDAPCHFAKGRWCVSDIPLERLVVPAVVVDVSQEVNSDSHLTKDLLLAWEDIHGQIPDNSLLLVYTGWSKYWPDRLNYTGTEEKNISALKFPSIKAEAAEWLVAKRKVVGVGIDTMSVDIPNERPSTHVALMTNNIYGLENVNNLDQLPPTGAMVYVMPMKLKSASGAPCRLLAQIPNGMFNGGNFNGLPGMSIYLIIFIATSYYYRFSNR